MAEHLNTNGNPMATFVGVITSFIYGLFFAPISIFINFKDFGEHAIKAIILASIGWITTKILEKIFKKTK